MSKKIARKILYVCTGSKCKKHGSKQIAKDLKKHSKEKFGRAVQIIRTRCTDNCKWGPVVCLQPENTWHFHVDEKKALGLLDKLDREP